MALKQCMINANSLSIGKHCRLDPKYTFFTQIQEWRVFKTKLQQVKLSKLLVEIPLVKISKGQLEEEAILVNISDQEQNSGELKNLEKTTEIGSDKNSLTEADIFISKLGMPKGYIFINSYKGENIIGSSEFIPYRLLDIDYLIFLKYLLINKKMLFAYSSLESGKTPSHKRVNPYEFLNIKIPLLSKPAILKIIKAIKPIEEKIVGLKAQITPPQEIINKVFSKAFKFNENLYNEFGKGMTAGTQNAKVRKLKQFEVNFKEILRSNILRFSTRYYNPPTIKLMDFLDKIDTLFVKDIETEINHRGASPKYNEEGDIPVVKTTHLKNGYIEISKEEFVDEEFYNSYLRSQIKEKDILIASTGKVSLGKIDLLETDEKLVIDSHISIIRIDEKKYNPLFFVYYFRSVLGYFQVERDFTGATNQIELSRDEIANFKIPDISLPAQKKIVNEIKTKLDKQNIITKKIEEERKKIDLIIEKAIC